MMRHGPSAAQGARRQLQALRGKASGGAPGAPLPAPAPAGVSPVVPAAQLRAVRAALAEQAALTAAASRSLAAAEARLEEQDAL